MPPEKDIKEGFEERFNIFVERANMRGVLNTGSDPRRVWQTQISLTWVRVVQNSNKLLDRRTHD